MTSTLHWTPLTAHVWTTRVEPHGVTCGLVIGSQHVLLVDTGSTPQQGTELAMAAARALGRPVDRIVLTHHHDDHVGGLGGLDAPSWMHRRAAEHCADALDAAGAEVTHPISLMAYLDLGDVAAEVVHPGAGHTDGDLVVRVAADEVILVGDLLETSGDPQADDTTDFWSWAGALDTVMNLTDGKGLFVPEHGDPTDAQGVMAQRNAIWDVVSRVRDAMERGQAPTTVLDADDLPFSPATVTDWVPSIADQLAARGITRKGLLPLSQR